MRICYANSATSSSMIFALQGFQEKERERAEREQKEKGSKVLLKEIIAEILPDLGKETDIQVLEAQRALKRKLRRSK